MMDLLKFLGTDPQRIYAVPLVPRNDTSSLLDVEQSYFRIKLSQMALRDRSRFTSERYPVIHATTEFSIIGGHSNRATVISPTVPGQKTSSNLGSVLLRDQDLTNFIVFRGGPINLALGLYSAPGDDWANQFFDLAKAITQVSSSIALTPGLLIAEPIKKAFDQLSGNGKMTLEIGLKLDLISSQLISHQYLAIVAVPDSEFEKIKLSIIDGSLYYNEAPLETTDFILLRTDFLSERDDLPQLEISRHGEKLIKDVAEIFASPDSNDEIDRLEAKILKKYQFFVAQVFSCEMLTAVDRNRLIAGVKVRIKDIQTAFQDSRSLLLRSRGGKNQAKILVEAAAKENPELFKLPLNQTASEVACFSSIADAMSLN